MGAKSAKAMSAAGTAKPTPGGKTRKSGGKTRV